MDQNQPIQNNGEPTVEAPQNKSSIGSIVGTIIIIALIILGGLYFWGKRIEEAKSTQNVINDQTGSTETTDTDQEAAAIKSMSSSDDINSIEADVQSTNLDNLDAELNAQLH